MMQDTLVIQGDTRTQKRARLAMGVAASVQGIMSMSAG
jgi:hypothetical protein